MVKAYAAANVIFPLCDYSKGMMISGMLAPGLRKRETMVVMGVTESGLQKGDMVTRPKPELTNPEPTFSVFTGVFFSPGDDRFFSLVSSDGLHKPTHLNGDDFGMVCLRFDFC